MYVWMNGWMDGVARNATRMPSGVDPGVMNGGLKSVHAKSAAKKILCFIRHQQLLHDIRFYLSLSTAAEHLNTEP